MKHCFRSNTIILAITILILPLLYCCTQSEHNDKAVIISQSQEIITKQEHLISNKATLDIELQKREIITPSVYYNLVIPGSTIQSAEFMPGIQNGISMDGVSLSVPACGMKQTKRYQLQVY